MTSRRSGMAGYTLVELMATVMVVAVLAVLATVAYGRYIRAARVGEATAMIASIRAGQERYRSEVGSYLNASRVGGSQWSGSIKLHPADTPGPFKKDWDAPCASCIQANAWQKIGVRPSGPVMFSYGTVAGRGGKPADLGVSFAASDDAAKIANSDVGTGIDWYVAVAAGDTDGNDSFCTVAGASWTNHITIDHEGE